jgi:hypothetical protein
VLNGRSKVQLSLLALLLSAAPVLLLHTSLYHTGLQSEFVLKLLKFHKDIILSHGFAPFQYRVLAYWLPEWLSRAGIPLHLAYTINRYFWTAAGLFLLFALFRKWFGVPLSLVGCLLYLAPLSASYFGGGLQPSDAPLFVVFVLGYLVLQADQFGWLLLLVPLGALFHETALWLAPIAAIFWGRQSLQARRLALLGLLVALWIAIYFGVRYIIGPRPLMGELFEFGNNLRDPYAYINTAIMLSPLIFLGHDNWSLLPGLAKSGLVFAPVAIAAIWSVARPSEARLFLPLLPIFIVVPLVGFGQLLAVSNEAS